MQVAFAQLCQENRRVEWTAVQSETRWNNYEKPPQNSSKGLAE